MMATDGVALAKYINDNVTGRNISMEKKSLLRCTLEIGDFSREN